MFSVKQKSSRVVQIPQKEIHIAVSNVDILSVQRLLKNGADANDKEIDGTTPLHYAVATGSIDIVNILLQNGADVTHVTDHGDSPLHTAASKGDEEIVDVLLQQLDREKLNCFINAKTFYSGMTALHLAAKSGYLKVVKSLLRHGAIYNIDNIEDVAPIALAKDQEIITLMRLIEELFQDAKKGNGEIISKLEAVTADQSLAILNTRNNQGHTLQQTVIANGHNDVANQLLTKVIKQPDSPKPEMEHLKKLQSSAVLHFEFSKLYLPMLKNMSHPYGSEKNPSPWKTLKEGSYYLGNAFKLIELYKKCMPGPIANKDIQLVNDTLVALEFDPSHVSRGYTDEAYGGQAECFVSKGQGTKYYNLLHSEMKKDVRLFIEMVELNIDKPLKTFLDSINQNLQIQS